LLVDVDRHPAELAGLERFNRRLYATRGGHGSAPIAERIEEAIRAYMRNQKKKDQRLDQLNLWR
jgi:hypothetical protein